MKKGLGGCGHEGGDRGFIKKVEQKDERMMRMGEFNL